MEKRRRKKVREDDRASGIAPEEDKELDKLLDEIMELFDESDKAIVVAVEGFIKSIQK